MDNTIIGLYQCIHDNNKPHITLPQDERTTANNIFIPERPQPIKCRTRYHRWNYTTIQNHFNITGIILQDKRKHLYQRQRRIYLCRLICFLMHCNEEDKQSPPTTIQDAIKRYYFNSTHFNSTNHTGGNNTFHYGRAEHRSKTTSNYFNMDNLQTGRAIIFPISHYKETSRTTYHKQDKTRTHGK